ncbi:MAG: SH3 domain-containing protein [Clostridia bacterium]|nr:SH3 domain-containing protein [Clostridia bacterium]
MKKFFSFALAILLSVSLFSAMPKVQATTKPVGAGRVTTASTSLNVRSSPSTSASVKARLKRNAYVTLIKKSGSFWYVRYGESSYGYCHQDYITQTSTKVRQVKTSSGRLNVRSGASTSHTITDYLESGRYVTVLSEADNNFAKIIYKGSKTGYVHTKYLVTPSATSTKYKAIKLNVPDYKQTDSRWASITLGSSGQTIGKIGCATTALAMTESYRTGTTIYPHQMAKKLSYTSGGAVYWPTNYNIITSSEGYLEKIYNALQSGKPVIVGSKKSNGSQHYVVVTGVNATSTLTNASFIINDPGSSTRTTLAQFFAAYPNYYKMLYVK